MKDILAPDPNPVKPAYVLPPGACDAHCHVFGPGDRFPYSPGRSYTPPDAPKEKLAALHKHLGFSRAVLVQASCHGTDNSAMLDAIAASNGSIRGVAMVSGDVTDRELERLHTAGVRGARFNFVAHLGGAPDLKVVAGVAARIADLGWHLQVHLDAEDILTYRDFLDGLQIPFIIDHMGRPDVKIPVESNDYFKRLIDLGASRDGIFWKLTSPDRYTRSARPEDWPVVLPFAHALLRHFPGNVISGTDRPRPNMNTVIVTGRGNPPNKMPNDVEE